MAAHLIAVARYLQANGWPDAKVDVGDISGTPNVCWSIKGGHQARTAYDDLITEWLTDLETQRGQAAAAVGVLVLQRRGFGLPHVDRWWAIVPADAWLLDAAGPFPLRMSLADAVRMLRTAGYGDPLPEAVH